MDIREVIRKHALKNAYDYGQADLKSVVSKVLAEAPQAKQNMKETMSLVSDVVKEVNAMKKPAIEKGMATYVYEEKAGKHEHEWTLEGAVQGHVVTRFAPEPSGYLHIGHVKALMLNAKAAETYGRSIGMLRFDDTNPDKENQEFVDSIQEGVKWLEVTFEEPKPRFASDDMPQYYKLAEQLIKQGDAYACACTQEEMSADRAATHPCRHRTKSKEENESDWQRMKEGKVDEGALTLRFVGDMKSLNTTLRDPVIFRILKTPHYRQKDKYSAWPVYDFETPIEDSLHGVTHVMRSKEYELRDELYRLLLKKLKLRVPFIYDFSRLELKGTVLSKRHLRPLIEQKTVWGWDDPRLPTIAGLRRRGIIPEAIKEFVLSFGLSKVESEPGWDKLLSINRKLLEPVAEHYYVVPSPHKLVIRNAKPDTIELPKLPSEPLKNARARKLQLEKEFWIAKSDFDALKEGETFRLKGAYNVKITKKHANEIEGEPAGTEMIKGRILQFVPAKDAVKCTLIRLSDLFVGEKFNPESLTEEQALAEPAILGLKEGQIIQAERVGYLHLDDKKKIRFILAS